MSYAERQVAIFNVRVSDDLAVRFDAVAEGHGGRSAMLRAVMEVAARSGAEPIRERSQPRPIKLTVRLSARDSIGLDAAAHAFGLGRNAWAAALIRRRLHDQPTFSRTGELAVIAIQGDLRRIGVNVNQIARALNTACVEGRDPDLQSVKIGELQSELRGHLQGLREALMGNLAYWDVTR